MTLIVFSRFSPPVLSFLKSCNDKNLSSCFIWIASKNEPEPKSKYIKKIYRFSEEDLFSDKGIIAIQSITKDNIKSCLISINENISSWLIKNSAKIGENCHLFLPNRNNIQKVLSKKNQVEYAKKAGLSVLPSYLITQSSESLNDIPQQNFPLCLRPAAPGNVVPVFKVHMVNSLDELKSFILKFKKINGFILAQPFLNLPNLVIHGSRKNNGTTIGMQGFIVDRKFEGLTLTIKPFNLTEDLREKCIKFTEFMEIFGPYHFEFLFDEKNHKEWFLELNNRLGGTTAKVFALGYDEPGYMLQSFGYDVHISKKLTNQTASSKMALFKYLYNTLAGRITPLDYPAYEIKLKRIIATLTALFLNKDDIFSLKDVKGAVYFYTASLRQKLNTF